MRVAIIGTGQQDLVVAGCICELGHSVSFNEIDFDKLTTLKESKLQYDEPGLVELLENHITQRNLTFPEKIRPALSASNVILLGSGILHSAEESRRNLYSLADVVREIAATAGEYKVIVITQTFQVGMAEDIESTIRKIRPDANQDIVVCPVFLTLGLMIGQFLRPDRIILGSKSDKATNIMRELYRPFYLIETPILATTPQDAELIQLTSDSFISTKMAFAEEMRDLSKALDVNFEDLIKGLSLDGRIGKFKFAYNETKSGAISPHSVSGLIQSARQAGTSVKVVEAAAGINAGRQREISETIKNTIVDIRIFLQSSDVSKVITTVANITADHLEPSKINRHGIGANFPPVDKETISEFLHDVEAEVKREAPDIAQLRGFSRLARYYGQLFLKSAVGSAGVFAGAAVMASISERIGNLFITLGNLITDLVKLFGG